jgi:ABC-2 type transport system permease protein
LQKEFLQIFRNRAMLPIIFVMPIIQLIILGNAATFEIRQIEVVVVDQDHSPTSRLLVNKLEASGYFVRVAAPVHGPAEDALLDNSADIVIRIPRFFERDLQRIESADLQLVLDAQDAATSGVAFSYASSIIASLGEQIAIDRQMVQAGAARPEQIRIVPASWYNPDLSYTTYMVPGILVLLVTMIGAFLSAMNVVREKEIGTIEQLNVTPIRKYQFIIGKLLPFLVIALFELAFGLVVARLLFDIPMLGSLPLIFGLAALYLLAVLGIGLWISTFTNTQQQAMFIAWFFMVVFILMSGLFTPIESMPQWAQELTRLNPVAYFIKIMRRVMLKGAGFEAVAGEAAALAVYAVLALSLAVRQHRKVSA